METCVSVRKNLVVIVCLVWVVLFVCCCCWVVLLLWFGLGFFEGLEERGLQSTLFIEKDVKCRRELVLRSTNKAKTCSAVNFLTALYFWLH